MKKKILVLLILSCLFIVCSCGKKSSNPNEIVLSWCTDPNPQRYEQIALFEKQNPGIKVKLDTGMAIEKLLTRAAAGNLPDIIDLYWQDVVQLFAEKGVLLDITDLCTKYNVNIEVCGSWLWVDGDTKTAKETLCPAAIQAEYAFGNDRSHLPRACRPER